MFFGLYLEQRLQIKFSSLHRNKKSHFSRNSEDKYECSNGEADSRKISRR